MIQNASKALPVLDSMTAKFPGLGVLSIQKEAWKHSVTICKFLKFTASLRECESGPSYATLSVSTKALKALILKCKAFIAFSNTIFVLIAQKMVL